MQTVAIVGLGLIGGSFGLSLRRVGFEGRILGVSEPLYLQAALDRGAITEASTLERAASEADLIYLSDTVAGILSSLERLSGLVRANTLVSDVGSTKRAICAQAARFLPAGQFLGGHPMAGKEVRGIQGADDELFRNRPYILTPSSDNTTSSLQRQFSLWLERFGAEAVSLTAEAHDRAVAFTSHLPQLLSTALAQTLWNENNPDFLRVFGPGVIDMTRLALSSSELWTSVLQTNADEIREASDAFTATLHGLQQSCQAGDVAFTFAHAAQFAQVLRSLFTKV